MIINEKEQIWYEKYRPQRISDMILPDFYLNKFQEYIKTPTNLLLASENPGLGKTSLVNAIVKETGYESLFINASLDRSIEVIRSKIIQFASTKSFEGTPKIVVFDECDNMSADSFFATRGILDEFSQNCRFIMTCNYLNKIPEPIINRCELFNFDEIFSSNKEELIKKIYSRLIYILQNENITFNNADLLEIIKLNYPSVRGMFGILQRSTISGSLNITDVNINSDYHQIIEAIKARDFEKLVKVVYKIANPDGFYTWIFKHLESLKNKDKVIIICAKYQFQAASVRDKNLNLCACCLEIAPLI